MKRQFPRILCAFLGVFGAQAHADIPMVTTPMILPVARALPQLPRPAIAQFGGVTQVSARTEVEQVQSVDVTSQIDVSAFGFACDMSVDVTAVEDAMVSLEIYAPCQPHAAVHVSHGGLHFQAAVSMTGRAKITFPAMSVDAEVFVAVDEEIFERRVEVADARYFARVALIGAGPELTATALSKVKPIYHNQNMQMFSVDMRTVADPMTYRLALRHEVTVENCDRPIQTQMRRILPGQGEKTQILRLGALDCRRVGEILELKNIVPDLKLAAN